MPGASESRAAVFTSRPQDVEVYTAGEWQPGALLGWRHAATGGCQGWVRVSVGGTEESTWTDLECLRLAAREPAPVSEPAGEAAVEPVDDPVTTGNLCLVELSPGHPTRRGRPPVPGLVRTAGAWPAAPCDLPAVRDDAASRASHPAGRRRRADSRVVGETAEFPAVGSAPGRHRAPDPPSGEGRHRTADTAADAGEWSMAPDAGAGSPAARAAAAWGTHPDVPRVVRTP